MKRPEVVTGRIGELYAAAIIEELGWQTAFCQQTGVDLLCWRGKKFYRCQVKASTVHTNHNRMQFHFGIGSRKRMPTREDYDFACCVSVPQRKAYFMAISDVDKFTLSKTQKFFDTKNIEKNSFEKTMRTLDEFH